MSGAPSGGGGPKLPQPFQVVGFHVEGGNNSPMLVSPLHEAAVGASSPTPVIIPPSFQAPPAASKVSTEASDSAPQPPATDAPHAPEPEPSALMHTTCSIPKPINQAELSEALHAGKIRTQQQRQQAQLQDEDEEVASSSLTSDVSTLSAPAPTSPPAPPLHLRKAPPPFPSSQQPGQQPAASASAEAAPAGKPPQPQHPSQSSRGAQAAGGEPKAMLSRADRRAIQEAQRAAKAAKTAGGAAPPPQSGKAAATGAGAESSKAAALKAVPDPPASGKGGKAALEQASGGSDGGAVVSGGIASSKPTAAATAAAAKKGATKVVSLASTEMFTHLQQYRKVSVPTLLTHKDAQSIHPAVLQLGLRYADGTISGANARCVAMMHTLCQVIGDYSTPDGKSLSRDLTQQINTIIQFLVECRPLSVSMGNAIKYLKLKLSKIDPSQPEAEAKADLIQVIGDFIQARITVADQMIVEKATPKVVDGDVILTFAYSHVVAQVLLEAARRRREFRVVVVDARPEIEGTKMLHKLLDAGVACSYVHLNAVSYAMREATKVILGAAAVMSNGTVMGRAGTAAVAMVAHSYSKPVLVCCESYKFHERVQLDSITHNELGDPDALTLLHGRPDKSAPLQGWHDQTRLGILNLKYDAMPAEYVAMIVTEFGVIPPTSVPVILRECRQEN